jgi:hypothetical protein
VPDARTIWLFREKLTKAGAIEKLSDLALQKWTGLGCHALDVGR